MRRECRERFPPPPISKKLLYSDPGMHHGTCVTHVPWCMSGSLTFGDGENVPGIPGACTSAILRIWQEAHVLGRRQAIICTSAEIFLIGYLETNVNEILIDIQTFSFKKMRLKMSYAKWRPFCLGPNVIISQQRNLRNCSCWHGSWCHISTFKPRYQLIWYDLMCQILRGTLFWLECVRLSEHLPYEGNLIDPSKFHRLYFMMTSSNGSISRVTGPFCGEFTGLRWIPLTKASDAELWCFSLICTWINGGENNREAGDLRCHRVHYDVIVMCSPNVWHISVTCDWYDVMEIAAHGCLFRITGHLRGESNGGHRSISPTYCGQ